MKNIVRHQYRATLKPEINEEDFIQAAEQARQAARRASNDGKILTCALCRYQRMLFLYVEFVIENDSTIENPALWMPELSGFLCKWPEMDGEKEWVDMFQVFWFDTPVSIEQWKRKQKPDKRCGRIAVLYPDKMFSYICHHQAIVAEGLLTGDRYQCIAVHENILFSYFETPRDREVVNIKKENEPSSEIEKWKNVNPASHFDHFTEAKGADFLIIETVFDVG